ITPEPTVTPEPEEEITPEPTVTPEPEEEIAPEPTVTPIPDEVVRVIIPYTEPQIPIEQVAETKNTCTDCCGGYAREASLSAENYQYVHKIQTIVSLDETADTVPYTLYHNGKPWYSGELKKSGDFFDTTICETCHVVEDHLNDIATPGTYLLVLENDRFCADSDDQGRLVFLGQRHSSQVTPDVISPDLVTILPDQSDNHQEGIDGIIVPYSSSGIQSSRIERLGREEQEEGQEGEAVGELNFEQYPTGYEVYLDNKYQGNTPLILTRIPLGEYKVTIETTDLYNEFIVPLTCTTCRPSS
ncbi:MAG: PEGA domain-containing protein, partial [Methanospirillaceae archaeon]|nr:PEGA domain-containing protein [Methanospirillaceae archaeon]